MVVRSAVGAGGRFGAIHSQSPIAWFQAVPGLKIVAPATPTDAKALLSASIRDDNPVLFLEHKRLYAMKEEVADPVSDAGVASAVVRRSGTDVTLISCMNGVHDCLRAAELLDESGVSAEVVDLRTVRPLDRGTILASLERTSRVAIVEEGPRGGWAGEVLAALSEEALHDIDDAWRITTPEHPIPYSPRLEDTFLPDGEAIAAGVRARLGA
jgi:pyruvate/2-oxoglutarate/acetoin dehydrogenase E1 component